ncbi:MAG TPA: hypothetical protein VK923_09075 [Euzebyales bacterium]|nr:hypothetical protein [Euzebyales bacterium]
MLHPGVALLLALVAARRPQPPSHRSSPTNKMRYCPCPQHPAHLTETNARSYTNSLDAIYAPVSTTIPKVGPPSVDLTMWLCSLTL